MSVQRTFRKAELLALTGYSNTEFHEAVQRGSFPPPDGEYGPRTPIWFERTIEAWQQSLAEAGRKPCPMPEKLIEAQKLRRRTKPDKRSANAGAA